MATVGHAVLKGEINLAANNGYYTVNVNILCDDYTWILGTLTI